MKPFSVNKRYERLTIRLADKLRAAQDSDDIDRIVDRFHLNTLFIDNKEPLETIIKHHRHRVMRYGGLA